MINIKEVIDEYQASGMTRLEAIQEAKKYFTKKKKILTKSIQTYNLELKRKGHTFSHVARFR